MKTKKLTKTSFCETRVLKFLRRLGAGSECIRGPHSPLNTAQLIPVKCDKVHNRTVVHFIKVQQARTHCSDKSVCVTGTGTGTC